MSMGHMTMTAMTSSLLYRHINLLWLLKLLLLVLNRWLLLVLNWLLVLSKLLMLLLSRWWGLPLEHLRNQE
jgi:hypothetical protein